MAISCTKRPFDYRNKFIGNYKFTVHEQGYGPPPYSIDTIYYYDGKISYGSNKNTVYISFLGGGTTELTIYEDGTLEGVGQYCNGEFESTKKVKYSCWDGGLGSPTVNDVTGEKK